jgi:hypothetical protein
VPPIRFQEWPECRSLLPAGYLNVFDFSVQTGPRPPEQVALKWLAIDIGFTQSELGRVHNQGKDELKNTDSRRQIQLRPAVLEVLERQRAPTRHLESPCVFPTPIGTPIIQDLLSEHLKRAMGEIGLHFRRMGAI